MSDLHELRPARPEAGDQRSSYMPRLPWKWIGSVGLFLTLSIGTCQMRERQEADALRASVLKAHGTQLGPIVARYRTLVGKIRGYTIAAAQRSPDAYADPRLRLDALGSGKGLYLRLKATDATSAKQIDSASLGMYPDAIGRCLGLSPMPAAELFARGSFLEKSWIKQAEDASGVMKLRVVAEELRQRTKRDLPFVSEAVQAQWFMLVLERGENRRDAPVDAYLWDLRSDKLLLSARAKAEGALVAARIAVTGVKPGNYASGAQTGAAQDCSIAAQLRSVAGTAPTTFESSPPTPRQALEAAAPAAAAGASAAPAAGAPTPAAPVPATRAPH